MQTATELLTGAGGTRIVNCTQEWNAWLAYRARKLFKNGRNLIFSL